MNFRVDYHCHYCDKSYINEELLAHHISNVHDDERKEIVHKASCTKCPKEYLGSNLAKAQSLLKNHMFSSHGYVFIHWALSDLKNAF